MSVKKSDNQGISGTGYVSDDRTDDGLLKVHGVALGENDITKGHLSQTRKLWRPEVLKEAAEMLKGKDIVVNHENQSAYEKVGEITDSGYKEGYGIIYQGVVMSDELEPKIERGWLDVSPRIIHSKDSEEVTENTKAPVEIFDLPNLSIVRKGASHSNELLPGEHEELSIADIKSEFEEVADDTVVEYHSSVDELQQVSLRDYFYNNKNAAQGASEGFGCSGFHEHTIEGEKWFMPCDTLEQFLKNLAQKLRTETESDEMAEFDNRDFVMWDSSDGIRRGRIVDWSDDGVYDASIDGDYSVTGTSDDPAALIQRFENEGEEWTPTDIMDGKNFSALKMW